VALRDWGRWSETRYAYCPALETMGGATSGRTRKEALKNINEVVQMIVQEFIEVSRLRVKR
jgi:predicted RNase H-like HicB family nuclease